MKRTKLSSAFIPCMTTKDDTRSSLLRLVMMIRNGGSRTIRYCITIKTCDQILCFTSDSRVSHTNCVFLF